MHYRDDCREFMSPKPLLHIVVTDDAGFRYCVCIHKHLLF